MLPPEHDGVLVTQFKMEQGHLVRKVTQPSEDLILRQNQALRNEPEAVRPLSFMGSELRIPELHYYRLIKKYPELNSKDSTTLSKAWRKFLASAEADIYRTHHRSKARGANPASAAHHYSG